MINTPTDEDWIDLASLYSSSFFNQGSLVLDYDWNGEDEMNTEKTILHQLRKALRKVGHKITKMRSGYRGDKRVWTLYHTTITEEEGEKMRILWNDWLGEVAEEQYLDSDSESESDDSDDDNPSN